MRLIDANEALDAVDKRIRQIGYENDPLVLSIRQAVKDVKPVDAVPVVTGTWKAVTDDGENYKRICTCCGEEAPFDELEGVYLIYPHCPWCGADMWKEGDHAEGTIQKERS